MRVIIIIFFILLSIIKLYGQDEYTLYLEFRPNTDHHHWVELESMLDEPKHYCIIYDLHPAYNSLKDTITMVEWSFSLIMDDSSKIEYVEKSWLNDHKTRDINWLRFMQNETNSVGFFYLMKSYKRIAIFIKEGDKVKVYYCQSICKPAYIGDSFDWGGGSWTKPNKKP